MKSAWKQEASYWVVDFGVVSMFPLHLVVMLLLLLAVLLIHVLQALLPLMLLHHLVPLELLMALLVIVLQVIGGLQPRSKEREKIKEKKS